MCSAASVHAVSRCTVFQAGYGQGQGISSQGPQGGFSSQNGSPFGSMTGGANGISPLAQAPASGWGGGQPQQGVPQQTPPRAPTRKEAAAVHDPFAALTGAKAYCPSGVDDTIVVLGSI